ncbi:MAG: response regulator [Limisphaerales bacterium]
MSEERMLKVVLADDHQLFRDGIRLILNPAGDLNLVDEVDNGKDAVLAVERLKPDVLVLDLVIEQKHGLEVISEVAQRFADTRILVLTGHADEPFVREAMFNGADGYLLKLNSAGELLRAIRTVASGRVYVCDEVANLAGSIRRGERDRDIYDTLTERERVVMKLIAKGNTTPKIATELFISPRTAETHRTNLMRKLGCNSQTDIIRFAIRKGVVEV